MQMMWKITTGWNDDNWEVLSLDAIIVFRCDYVLPRVIYWKDQQTTFKLQQQYKMKNICDWFECVVW